MKIQSTMNVSETEKLKVMVYGLSGSGKTKLVSTLKERILLLNADKGMRTIQGSEIDYVTANSWEDIVEFLNYMKTKECSEKYNWIVFDTVTAMFDLLSAHLEKRQASDSKFDGFAFWKEYGGRLLTFLRVIRDQNTYNTLALFQHSTKEDKDGMSQQVFGLQGSCATRPPDFFDEVFVLRQDKNNARMLQTATSAGYLAKDRSQVLEKSEVADLSVVMAKILKGK